MKPMFGGAFFVGVQGAFQPKWAVPANVTTWKHSLTFFAGLTIEELCGAQRHVQLNLLLVSRKRRKQLGNLLYPVRTSEHQVQDP